MLESALLRKYLISLENLSVSSLFIGGGNTRGTDVKGSKMANENMTIGILRGLKHLNRANVMVFCLLGSLGLKII